MTWQYAIEWYPGGAANAAAVRKNVVVVTSKPRTRRADDIIRVDTWTSADPSADDDGAGAGAGARNLTAPVAVYARVTRRGLPVLGARVSVRVRIEQDAQQESSGALAGKDLSLAAVDLIDDGYGGELTFYC